MNPYGYGMGNGMGYNNNMGMNMMGNNLEMQGARDMSMGQM